MIEVLAMVGATGAARAVIVAYLARQLSQWASIGTHTGAVSAMATRELGKRPYLKPGAFQVKSGRLTILPHSELWQRKLEVRMFIIEYTAMLGRDPPQIIERLEVESDRLGGAKDAARLTLDRVRRRSEESQPDGYQIRDASGQIVLSWQDPDLDASRG